jgi:hypothetical protein
MFQSSRCSNLALRPFIGFAITLKAWFSVKPFVILGSQQLETRVLLNETSPLLYDFSNPETFLLRHKSSTSL